MEDRNKKILLVDDEPQKIESLAELLRSEFYTLKICTSVEEVKKLFNKQEKSETDERYAERIHYDLAIVDVMLFLFNPDDYDGDNESYDYLKAGLKKVVPELRERDIPILIYSAIPKVLFADLPEDSKDLPWFNKSDYLPSNMLQIIDQVIKTRRGE